MVRLNDFPPLTAEQEAEIEERRQQGRKDFRRGAEWANKLLDEMQKYPDRTLFSINIETGEYYTTPPSRDDMSVLARSRPVGDRSVYWTCRITEGTDGKKYPGGVYSVGAVQAHAHSPDLRRDSVHRHG